MPRPSHAILADVQVQTRSPQTFLFISLCSWWLQQQPHSTPVQGSLRAVTDAPQHGRAANTKEDIIQEYFDVLEDTMRKNTLLDKSHLLFNCDESAWPATSTVTAKMADTITKLVDALALLNHAMQNINQHRRDDLKGEMNQAYKGLSKGAPGQSTMLYAGRRWRYAVDVNSIHDIESGAGRRWRYAVDVNSIHDIESGAGRRWRYAVDVNSIHDIESGAGRRWRYAVDVNSIHYIESGAGRRRRRRQQHPLHRIGRWSRRHYAVDVNSIPRSRLTRWSLRPLRTPA